MPPEAHRQIPWHQQAFRQLSTTISEQLLGVQFFRQTSGGSLQRLNSIGVRAYIINEAATFLSQEAMERLLEGRLPIEFTSNHQGNREVFPPAMMADWLDVQRLNYPVSAHHNRWRTSDPFKWGYSAIFALNQLAGNGGFNIVQTYRLRDGRPERTSDPVQKARLEAERQATVQLNQNVGLNSLRGIFRAIDDGESIYIAPAGSRYRGKPKQLQPPEAGAGGLVLRMAKQIEKGKLSGGIILSSAVLPQPGQRLQVIIGQPVPPAEIIEIAQQVYSLPAVREHFENLPEAGLIPENPLALLTAHAITLRTRELMPPENHGVFAGIRPDRPDGWVDLLNLALVTGDDGKSCLGQRHPPYNPL